MTFVHVLSGVVCLAGALWANYDSVFNPSFEHHNQGIAVVKCEKQRIEGAVTGNNVILRVVVIIIYQFLL